MLHFPLDPVFAWRHSNAFAEQLAELGLGGWKHPGVHVVAEKFVGLAKIQVLDGLESGAQVVTSGVTKLQDGMKVSIWKE